MYETICPNCGRGYRDTKNRLSIAQTLLCFDCRTDDAEANWETDGGVLNDHC